MRLSARRGFSLVELMVALLLGTIVTLGIITMFSGTQESNAQVQAQARVQENARYAIDFLDRSLRIAGFVGCVSRSDALRSSINGEFANLPFEAAINTISAGYEGGTPEAATWSPALASLPTAGAGGIDTSTIEPGTDVLVVRHVGDEARFSVAQVSSNSPLTVRAPTDATLYTAGTIAVVSDCTKGTVFQITAAVVGGTNLVVSHGTGGPSIPGNAVVHLPGFNEENGVYGADASMYRVQTTVYYIAPSATTNNRGDTALALWRKVGTAAPEELIDGVSDLEVRFGIDTDADGVPNQYVDSNAVVDANRIATVRVRVTTTSIDVVPGANAVLTRTFETTVAIRNRLT